MWQWCGTSLLSASRLFSDRRSCTNPTGERYKVSRRGAMERPSHESGKARDRRQAHAFRRKQPRTGQDDENGDRDADRVVDVAHDGADDRRAAQEEDQRALVDRLCELEQHGLGRGHGEFVVAVPRAQRGERRRGEAGRGRGVEMCEHILRAGVSTGPRAERNGPGPWQPRTHDAPLLATSRTWQRPSPPSAPAHARSPPRPRARARP
jgi:hypothetical protein